MLQYATFSSACRPLAGQVSTVISGGCRWVRVTGTQSDESVEALMPLCREADAILVVDDNAEMADRLRVHGVHLTSCDRGHIIAVREKLGPHAIIGVTCRDIADVSTLVGLDADYITVPFSGVGNPADFYTRFAEAIRSTGAEVHLVASGNFPVDTLQSVIKAGAAGIEMSEEVFDAPDPAAFVKAVIETIKR